MDALLPCLLPVPCLLPPVLRRRRSGHGDGEHLPVEVDVADLPGDEELRKVVGVMGHLRLAHFLTNLGHESLVELASKRRRRPPLAVLLRAVQVLRLHGFLDVEDGAPGPDILVVLRAIFATVHLRLLLRGYGLRVGVALGPKAHHGHVAIHHAAVAAQAASPEIHAQRILGNGLVAAVQDEVLGHAVAAVVHVATALEELGASLGRIRRAERIGMVIVVELLQTHHAHVVLPSRLCLLLTEQRQHLIHGGSRSVAHVGPVHALGLHVHEVLARVVLARVPLRHVALEEVQDVVHLLGLDVRRGHHARFPQRLGLLEEPLCLEVEARRARTPEDEVEVHHATSGRPLEHGHVVAGAEYGHDERLEGELQSDRTIPGHEEGVPVHELSPLALAERLIGSLRLLFNLRDGPNDVVPMVALRGECAEEARHVAEATVDGARLDLHLSHHLQDDLPDSALAASGAWNVLGVPHHLLRQDAHAHLLEILHRIPRGFWIVLHKPFLRSQGSDALAHVRPPVHEGHVRLGTPTPRPQDMQAPRVQVRLLEEVVVRVPRLVLEDGRKGSRNPARRFVGVPHEALRVQFRRIHHGLAPNLRCRRGI